MKMWRVRAVMPESSPPMMPARARGREASAIRRNVFIQGDFTSIQQADGLVLCGATDTDLIPLQPFQVENMQRLAAGHHHQVGHIDDIVDRPQPEAEQQLLHGGVRFPHLDIAHDGAGIPPAVRGVFDGDGETGRRSVPLWDRQGAIPLWIRVTSSTAMGRKRAWAILAAISRATP